MYIHLLFTHEPTLTLGLDGHVKLVRGDERRRIVRVEKYTCTRGETDRTTDGKKIAVKGNWLTV